MSKALILAIAILLTMTVSGTGFALQKVFKKAIEFKAVGDEGKVVFSHESHTDKAKLECGECHPRLFKMKSGGDKVITMAEMKEGKFCGHCHTGKEKAAFGMEDKAKCGSCHIK